MTNSAGFKRQADEIREAIRADDRLAQHIAQVQISARRKTLGMAMSPGDDGITVQVPADTTPEDVVRLLSKNRHRIGAMLLKARQCAPDHPVKELVNGSGFLWFGRNNRLRLVDNPAETVRHVNDHGVTSERGTWRGRWFELDHTALRHGAHPLVDWYIREGTAWLERQTGPLWMRMSTDRRPLPVVRAADIGRTRWGKCVRRPGQERDEVTIAWQTFQLTPDLVRHVLTHELVHAAHPGGTAHGPEFWRAFNRTETGARENARRLNEAGRHVWMGDVR